MDIQTTISPILLRGLISGVSFKSFYKAKPEDYQWVSKVIVNDQSNKQQITTLLVLINTGARISEIVKGAYQDGWLIIKEGKNKASVRSVPLPDSLSSCRQEDIATSIDSFRRWFNKRSLTSCSLHTLSGMDSKVLLVSLRLMKSLWRDCLVIPSRRWLLSMENFPEMCSAEAESPGCD